MIIFLGERIQGIIPASDVYVFGSRVDAEARGGDIDILVVGHRKLNLEEKIQIRLAFYDRFGEQKLDIVSYQLNSSDPFLEYILDGAVKITE